MKRQKHIKAIKQDDIKNMLLSYDGSDFVKQTSIDLLKHFIDNEIELPDISPSSDNSIIFEFSDESLHYAIEIFSSGLISYFANKNGNDEFHNFKRLEDIKAKLLQDIETPL